MSADGAYVYRFRADGGRLLYVGLTTAFGQRLTQHAQSQPWWPAVRHIDLDHHPTREAAAAAEQEAIRTEGPVFNQQRYGATTIPSDVGARLAALRDRRTADLEELHELVPAALAGGMSEAEAGRLSGLARDTVRRLNGKERSRG